VNLVQEIARRAGLNLYLTGAPFATSSPVFPFATSISAFRETRLSFRKNWRKPVFRLQGADEDLRTLQLLMPGNVRAELNMTRAEVYDKPGRPPTISPATINEDLRRRDFTVNAMALSLNSGSRGLLLDPFNGVADIEAKVLRVLHNYAFLEEPVRLIRATRLSARFHWPLEERTQARYDAAKENNYIEYLSKPMIGYELEQLTHEDDPQHIMRALDKDGWLKILHPHWTTAKVDASDLGQVVKTRQMMNDLGYSVETGPIVMYFLTRRMGDKDTSEIQRMIPRRDFVDKWKHLESGAHDLAKKLTSKEAGMPSGAWKILSQATPENILFLTLVTKQQAVDQKLKNFFGKWRQVKEKLPFPEMAELRITPQLPEYQQLVDQACLLLMDGKLRSHTEIMNFLKPYEPPPPPPPPAPKRGRGKAATAAAGTGAVSAPTKRGRKPKGAAAPPPVAPEAPVQPAPQGDKSAAQPRRRLRFRRPLPRRKCLHPLRQQRNHPRRRAGEESRSSRKPAVKAVPAKPAKKQAKPPATKAVAKTAPAKKVPAKKAAPAKKPATKKSPAKKAAKKKR